MKKPEAVVHRSLKRGKAGTHALVIGVGTYPHLIGGRMTRAADAHGLGQLTSPPASARDFATWMIDCFKNPDRPLASVRLLLSEKRQSVFDAKPVLLATIDNIDDVVDDWFDDGDTHDDNLLMFFFCGHGLGNAQLLSLLAADYGADAGEQSTGAINFMAFRNAMNKCRAKHQCFFIDACQTNSMSNLRSGQAGRSLRTPDAYAFGTKKAQPTFYSTDAGSSASGNPNTASYFTSALLDGLNGRAGDKSRGDWRVTPAMLQTAIESYITRNGHKQQPTVDDIRSFFIHWIDSKPDVTVTITCEHPLALKTVSLACSGTKQIRKPGENPWTLELAADSYVFSALRAKQKVAEKTEFVMPPEFVVPLGRQP